MSNKQRPRRSPVPPVATAAAPGRPVPTALLAFSYLHDGGKFECIVTPTLEVKYRKTGKVFGSIAIDAPRDLISLHTNAIKTIDSYIEKNGQDQFLLDVDGE